jgi:hypothetical protein
VQEHSKSMTLLHGVRPRELNLDIKSRVSVPVSQSQVNKLRNLVGVVAEHPTDKVPLIFSASCSLIYVIDDRPISKDLLCKLLELGMLRQTFDIELNMVGNEGSLSIVVYIPWMKPKLYWPVRNLPSCKNNIPRSTVRDQN